MSNREASDSIYAGIYNWIILAALFLAIYIPRIGAGSLRSPIGSRDNRSVIISSIAFLCPVSRGIPIVHMLCYQSDSIVTSGLHGESPRNKSCVYEVIHAV